MIRYRDLDQINLAPSPTTASSHSAGRRFGRPKTSKNKIAAPFSVQIELNPFIINKNASNSVAIFVDFLRKTAQFRPKTASYKPTDSLVGGNGYARYGAGMDEVWAIP
jgi:hypothetical protein